MALFGFNRPDARALRRVAQSVRNVSNKNQNLAYPDPLANRFLSGKKLLVRFTLNGALTTSEASKAATITDQYGPGSSADTATAITAHNTLTSTGGVYIFEGNSGDAGLAMWDSGTDYVIIQLECP